MSKEINLTETQRVILPYELPDVEGIFVLSGVCVVVLRWAKSVVCVGYGVLGMIGFSG
ncbi:MAG: hypothetical protein LBL39_07965 [Planctomycetaceae bacterium]|nr:hypothetical protein [Planctomycetaceae bacterium]